MKPTVAETLTQYKRLVLLETLSEIDLTFLIRCSDMSQRKKLNLSVEADRVTALQWLDESDEGDNVVETDSECSELEDNVETQDVEPEILEVYYSDIFFIREFT